MCAMIEKLRMCGCFTEGLMGAAILSYYAWKDSLGANENLSSTCWSGTATCEIVMPRWQIRSCVMWS